MITIKKIIILPIIWVSDWIGRLAPEFMTKLRYFIRFKKRLNLKDPKDLNEKIQWLKLRSDISEWSRLSDKYLVREYVRSCGLDNILVKLYGRWDSADDIDFDKLPNSFVIKTNNGCGDVVLVNDKSAFDLDSLKKKFNKLVKNHMEQEEERFNIFLSSLVLL